MKDVFCNENYILHYGQNLFLVRTSTEFNLSFIERPKIKLSVLCFEDA